MQELKKKTLLKWNFGYPLERPRMDFHFGFLYMNVKMIVLKLIQIDADGFCIALSNEVN